MKTLFYALIAFMIFLFLNACDWNLEKFAEPKKLETCCDCPRYIIDNRDTFNIRKYKTVFIDSKGGNDISDKNGQCWMSENLNYGKFSKDDSLNYGEKHCWRDSLGACEQFGGFYSWKIAMNYDTLNTGRVQGICPKGWHLPNKDEYEQLRKIFSQNPNLLIVPGDNESKFYAKHIGYRDNPYKKDDPTWNVPLIYYWTSTNFDKLKASTFHINKRNTPASISMPEIEKKYAFCVRCLKDSI